MRFRVVAGQATRRTIPQVLTTDYGVPSSQDLGGAPRRAIALVERELVGGPNMLTTRELAPVAQDDHGPVVTLMEIVDHKPHLLLELPEVSLRCRLLQAKATVLAPATISSTILAAPTMLTPSTSWSGVMPRGLAQAPQSHTLPWLPMNSVMRSWSFGSPLASTPSLPPMHPRRTASIVQRTTASCPAVAAMLAAMKGSVARSGSSRPQVQLKISFSFISVSPQ